MLARSALVRPLLRPPLRIASLRPFRSLAPFEHFLLKAHSSYRELPLPLQERRLSMDRKGRAAATLQLLIESNFRAEQSSSNWGWLSHPELLNPTLAIRYRLRRS
jgi:hypothetical protein